MKVVHDWLKEYVGDDIPSPEKLEQLFTFHAFEVEEITKSDDHTVIEVKVLPDRSSDCLCHRGIAREIATLTGVPLVADPLQKEASLEPKTDTLTVHIENPEACRRFTGARITGVKIGPSPEWLQARLRALGQRSINNVVDATNYIMLGLGQPLHAYDAETFPHDDSGWHFTVRMAKEGETVTTLSDDSYELVPSVQLITETKSGVPVGIAGIKGGKYAEITASTHSIILEAANFDPVITRRASQYLKLQTDASKRFENDLPPQLAAYGLRDAVALILELAGGTCEGYVDVYPAPRSNPSVLVQHSHIESLLGISLTKAEITKILEQLGFAFTEKDGGWEVTAPFERTDILIAEDVIAEVGRVYGYEHVQSVVPQTVPLQEINARHYYSEIIRDFLRTEGFSEVITSSFRKKDEIELQNALASDKGSLRSSLRENIQEVLDRNMPNADLLKLRSVQVFEIGTVFTKKKEGVGVEEHTALTLGVRHKQTGPTPKDDERLKEIIAALGQALGIELSGTVERGIFECNLSAIIPSLPVPTGYTPITPPQEITYTPFSMYPFVSRDIALWAPEGVSADSIETLLKDKGGDLLVHSTVFDEFHKEGKVSYAFRLVFQSFDRTLTDEEVGSIMKNITDACTNEGYTVR